MNQRNTICLPGDSPLRSDVAQVSSSAPLPKSELENAPTQKILIRKPSRVRPKVPIRNAPESAPVVKSVSAIQPLFPDLEVETLIAVGGMGAVYRARQKKLDRLVALKVLAGDSDSQLNFASQFRHEAQTLARLNHPNIVTLYESGEIDRGPDEPPLIYFLMEFIDGPALESMLREKSLSLAEIYLLVADVCDGLHYAHEKGVIHQDIKPANLLLDSDRSVRLADFGVARMLSDPEDESSDFIMATPQYAAPELIDPTSFDEPADHRADIYSIGVVLYELIVGRKPGFKKRRPSAVSEASERADRVVLKALQRNPEHRYQSAAELREALLRLAERSEKRWPNLRTWFARKVA
ncbi:MAG: serine/threonine-protein kinase [Verrucomicrobiota bacterium]